MGKKVLFYSGGGGLGHFARDLAIANELRKIKPGCEILWMAEEPASHVIKEAGEKVIDENCGRLNETFNLLPNENSEFNVNMFMLDYYQSKSKEDFAHQMAIIEREKPDIVVGDEDFAMIFQLPENQALMKQPFIAIWDFTKVAYSMTYNPKERFGLWMMNRMWHTGSKREYTNPAAMIFLLPKDDIPDERLGLFLMNTRDVFSKQKSNYFVGYPIHFDPEEYKDTAALKKRLGYGKEPLIVCAVGGTFFGKGLLNLCGMTYPLIKAQIPDVKMVMVAGPSIETKSLKMPDGIEVRGYVPDLFEHFAACDLAIVLGGGTSTLELAALKRPFIYFPLEKHAEQQIVIARRNERYHAGIKMLFSKTTPEALAQAVVSNIGKKVEYLEMPIDGCKKAAEVIAKFM
ncbi:MAG: glycosyltransferase [Candidatus Methanomethylicaceae archaeon]|jgi:UDP-N-acetylglucosamine:LPS N-acetylglucosamine transferase